MALILLGKSSCGLCGNLLLDSETIVALLAIADATHPLFAYFDWGFHRACFQAWEHRDEALLAARRGWWSQVQLLLPRRFQPV